MSRLLLLQTLQLQERHLLPSQHCLLAAGSVTAAMTCCCCLKRRLNRGFLRAAPCSPLPRQARSCRQSLRQVHCGRCRGQHPCGWMQVTPQQRLCRQEVWLPIQVMWHSSLQPSRHLQMHLHLCEADCGQGMTRSHCLQPGCEQRKRQRMRVG